MARRLPLHFPICRDLTSVGTPYKSQHTTGFRHPSALFTELFRTCVSSCSLLSINNWAVFLDSSARSDHVLVILQQHIENHARLGGHACWHACDFPTAAESSCRSQCGWQTTQVSMKCCARTADCLAPNFAKLKPDREVCTGRSKPVKPSQGRRCSVSLASAGPSSLGAATTLDKGETNLIRATLP